MQKLTPENYAKGFLMDEELMGGLSDDKESPGTWTAVVVNHQTGETLAYQKFSNLFEAIRAMNDIPRAWSFEAVSRCGSGNCGTGKCGKGAGGCAKPAPCAGDNASHCS
jgi:hypothetical protein